MKPISTEIWCRFIKKYEHLSSEDTLYIESTIDDPSITDEGGKYEVYHFKCGDEGLPDPPSKDMPAKSEESAE